MKKRSTISILTAALMGISATAVPIAAELPTAIVAEAADSDFTYTVSGSTVTITGYTGNSGNLKIPSKINGKTVKHIGAGAFYGKLITTVDIPSTVVSIGDNAFGYCMGVYHIVIPSSVTSIGRRAFYYCTSLKTAEIKGAAAINDEVFLDCWELQDVSMHPNCYRADNGNANVANAQNVFTNCSKLTKINGKKVIATQRGDVMPSLNTDSAVRNIIKKFCLRSKNVWFIDIYCSNLCSGVMVSQCNGWMKDTANSRLMHDWVVRNCDKWISGSQFNEAIKASDPELNSDTGVLMGYGLNGVCRATPEGFARVYQRMLYEVGVNAYVVKKNDRYWNVQRINGKYYQTDIEKDNYDYDHLASQNTYETSYKYYLKSNSQMKSLLGSSYQNPTVVTNARYYIGSLDTSVPSKCTYTFNDSVRDGILDGDWDFNDVIDSHDAVTKQAVAHSMGVSINAVAESDIKYFFTNLVSWEISPNQFIQYYG